MIYFNFLFNFLSEKKMENKQTFLEKPTVLDKPPVFDIKKTVLPSSKLFKKLEAKIVFTYTTSPNEDEKKTFFIHLLDDPKLNQAYDTLHDLMQIQYLFDGEKIEKVEMNAFYAGHIEFPDDMMHFNGFYRVQILSMMNDDGKYNVRCIDFGDQTLLKIEDLR